MAREAGLSLMAVSYAMRNSPKVALATRRRVQAIAKRIGYIPHPEIGRLMHLIRLRKPLSVQPNVAMLSFVRGKSTEKHAYVEEVFRGAATRSQELGYTLDVIQVTVRAMQPGRLTTMLRTRGMRGILVPPIPDIVDCSTLLDWSQFSVVAATNAARNLPCNRVAPHYLYNIQLALERLHALGRRRIALVNSPGLLQRTQHAYVSALAYAQTQRTIEPIPTLAATALNDIETWIRAHRPEVLLMDEGMVKPVQTALRQCGLPCPQIVLMNHSGREPFAGVNPLPYEIGRVAMETLSAQLQHGDVGFPEHCRTILIPGVWHAAPPLRRP